MINEYYAKKFCKEDISKIENYDKAIADTSQTWHCHHRDEVKILPSGMTVIRSMQDLKDAGRYYDCPANELIFLTKSEHQKLHATNMSDKSRQKISAATKGEHNPMYGNKHSAETRKKIGEAQKHRTRMPMSEATKRKIREARIAYWARRKGECE